MAVGTNLKFNTNSKRLMAIVQQLLGNKRFNAMNQKCRAVICSKLVLQPRTQQPTIQAARV
jgi:hypothetical protein